MACIICFFEDDFQENLRNISQQRTAKFEDTISEYKTNFISELSFLERVCECRKHKNYKPSTVKWATDLEESLKSIDTIGDYFDSIKDIYITWLKGQLKQSIIALTKIIDDNELLEQEHNFEKNFFFRGRYSKNYLETDELFHIPFNKRYLISSQRYSITGQPILYLGLSILDVFAELKLSASDFFDINFSYFILKPDQKINIFDFTSEFEELLTAVESFAKTDIGLTFDDPLFAYDKKAKKMLFKSILISLCSFKRRKESENWSFCEEYVLPQLITEIAREKKYDGILFTSTRINKSIAYSEETFYVNRHKLNLALFTNYWNDKFDTNLISKFEISKPIKFSDTHKISIDELEKLKKQNKELMTLKSNKFSSLMRIAEFAGIPTKLSFDKLVVKEFNLDSYIPYELHPTGQVHYYLLYQIFLTIRNNILANQ